MPKKSLGGGRRPKLGPPRSVSDIKCGAPKVAAQFIQYPHTTIHFYKRYDSVIKRLRVGVITSKAQRQTPPLGGPIPNSKRTRSRHHRFEAAQLKAELARPTYQLMAVRIETLAALFSILTAQHIQRIWDC